MMRETRDVRGDRGTVSEEAFPAASAHGEGFPVRGGGAMAGERVRTQGRE